MKVWIFQTGEPLHIDTILTRPMRAMNLANFLTSNAHEVTIWTSSFYHQSKEHRYNKFKSIKVSDKLTIKLIPSRGYKKNIGLSRLIDHIELGINLTNELAKISKLELPSVSFIGYPPIEFGYKASMFLKKNNIPYILDAKDMWPDYFIEKIPKSFRFFGKLIFFPWFLMASYTFKNATSFSTISESFMNWMLKVGKREKNNLDIVAPTSTSYSDLYKENHTYLESKWMEIGVNLKKDKIFFYAGTLNRTLDFEAIQFTAEKFAKINKNIKFVICGDGPEINIFMKKFSKASNVIFTGWLERKMLFVLGKKSIASIIPYKNSVSFSLGIPNKVSDALSLSLPIITCLDGEVRSLVDLHKVGQYYDQNNHQSFLRACNYYLNSQENKKNGSKNAKKLYDLMFDKNLIYNNLVNRLETISRL